jgi:hypothetical protein
MNGNDLGRSLNFIGNVLKLGVVNNKNSLKTSIWGSTQVELVVVLATSRKSK